MKRQSLYIILVLLLGVANLSAAKRIKPSGEAVELPALLFKETGLQPKGATATPSGYSIKIEYLLDTGDEEILSDDNIESGSSVSIEDLMNALNTQETPKPTKNEAVKEEKKSTANVIVNSSWYIKLKEWADTWINVPYLSGGMSKSGTDCSGFSSQLYLNVFNITLQRQSKMQFQKNCHKIVKKADLQVGDLLFFVTNGKSMSTENISHVGVYVGGDKKIFVHASSSKGVVYSSLDEAYYLKTYLTAGRVINFVTGNK